MFIYFASVKHYIAPMASVGKLSKRHCWNNTDKG